MLHLETSTCWVTPAYLPAVPIAIFHPWKPMYQSCCQSIEVLRCWNV